MKTVSCSSMFLHSVDLTSMKSSAHQVDTFAYVRAKNSPDIRNKGALDSCENVSESWCFGGRGGGGEGGGREGGGK